MAKFRMKNKGGLMTAAGVVAGLKAGQMVAGKIPVANNMVKAAAVAAAGYFLSTRKNELVKGAGYGMIAAGVSQAMPEGIGMTVFNNPAQVMGTAYNNPSTGGI